MEEKEEIKEETKPIVETIRTTAKSYAKGALIGGVLGGIFALATKRRVILWGGLGVIAGGFIAYRIAESSDKAVNNKTEFKNYG